MKRNDLIKFVLIPAGVGLVSLFLLRALFRVFALSELIAGFTLFPMMLGFLIYSMDLEIKLNAELEQEKAETELAIAELRRRQEAAKEATRIARNAQAEAAFETEMRKRERRMEWD